MIAFMGGMNMSPPKRWPAGRPCEQRWSGSRADTILGVRLDGAVTVHDDDGAPSSDVMATIPGYSLLALGDAVGLRATLADAVLFSPETGARL